MASSAKRVKIPQYDPVNFFIFTIRSDGDRVDVLFFRVFEGMRVKKGRPRKKNALVHIVMSSNIRITSEM